MTDPKSGAGDCSYKKHMHKSFQGPEMMKKNILMCCERASGIWRELSEGPRPISEQADQKQVDQL